MHLTIKATFSLHFLENSNYEQNKEKQSLQFVFNYTLNLHYLVAQWVVCYCEEPLKGKRFGREASKENSAQ